MKKVVLLLLALLVPTAIFIFLKRYGRNEFTIPVYYEQSVAEIPTACGPNYQAPYRVAEAALRSLGWQGNASLIVADTSQEVQKGLRRLREEFDEASVQFISPSMAEVELDKFYTCSVFLQKPWTAILLDDQRRIRGYYAPGTREEIDRLTVEIKILLNQY